MNEATFWTAFAIQLVTLGGAIGRVAWLVATMRSDIEHNGSLLVGVQSRLDRFSERLNGAETQTKINKAALEILSSRVSRVESHTDTPKPPGYGVRSGDT